MYKLRRMLFTIVINTVLTWPHLARVLVLTKTIKKCICVCNRRLILFLLKSLLICRFLLAVLIIILIVFFQSKNHLHIACIFCSFGKAIFLDIIWRHTFISFYYDIFSLIRRLFFLEGSKSFKSCVIRWLYILIRIVRGRIIKLIIMFIVLKIMIFIFF